MINRGRTKQAQSQREEEGMCKINAYRMLD